MDKFSQVVVIGVIIYCLINKIPLSYDGLNLLVENFDLTQLSIVSVFLSLHIILLLFGETTIGIVIGISSFFLFFIESNRFIIFIYWLTILLKTLFYAAFWLYDKYCKYTGSDKFIRLLPLKQNDSKRQ